MMKWLLLLLVVSASLAAWYAHTIIPPTSPESGLSRHSSEVRDCQGLGYVEPVSEVRKLTPRTGGVIKKCYYQVGDRVKKDAVIMELDDATQQADVTLARRQYEMIRADVANVNAGINPFKIKETEHSIARLQERLRYYQVEAERYRTLLSNQSASRQEHESYNTLARQTEMELKSQQADLEYLQEFITPQNRAWQESRVQHAEAGLMVAEERLQQTRVLAPFDGNVLRILKREGEGVGFVQPDPVVLFGDMSTVRVRAEIDERFVQQLAPGQSALIYGRNLAGETYPGKVAYIENIMGDKSVFTQASSERKDLEVLQMVIDMEPGFHCPSGLRVDVTIFGATKDVAQESRKQATR